MVRQVCWLWRLPVAVLAALLAAPPTTGQVIYNVTKIADTSGPFARFGPPSINGTGTIAYTAYHRDTSQSVRTSTGVVIADTHGPFIGGFDARTSINDAGVVSFVGAYTAGIRSFVLTGA